MLLFALLALAGGLGAWNYKQNVEAERAELRPFRSYSDADLESLTEAYRAEVETYTKRYEALTGRKVSINERVHTDQKLHEFERVQRISQNTRDIVTQLAQRHVAIEQLDAERRKRVGERNVVMLFLKRLLTYQG
jgi:ribosomal protein L9